MNSKQDKNRQTNDSPMVREKKTIRAMIDIYCSAHHGERDGLCDDCDTLLEYAHLRLAHCPFGPEKPACSKCPVHCYKKAMREKICEVMRYAGPRMLLRHPILAVGHLMDSRKEVPKP